jgi:hypothetical protein
MNAKAINKLSKIFTDDCVIKMANGDEFNGALEMSAFILGFSDGYTDAYIRRMNARIIKGFAIGAGIAVTGIGICEIIKAVNNKKTKITKEEA